jgi:hypothetical protein
MPEAYLYQVLVPAVMAVARTLFAVAQVVAAGALVAPAVAVVALRRWRRVQTRSVRPATVSRTIVLQGAQGVQRDVRHR